MADTTVPVTYRKGKLRASGLGSLARAKDGSSGQFYVYGDNGPELTDLSSLLDDVIGSTRGALLMRGSSGWAKIDPGTSGNFLKSNGAGADPSYAAVAQSKLFIDSKTANNSADHLDFTSGIDGTYPNYLFTVENLVPASSGITAGFQVSTDGGSTWESTNYLGGSGETGQINVANSLSLNNTAGRGLCGDYTLCNPASTSVNKNLRGQISFYSTTPSAITTNVGGWWFSTTAVNAVRWKTSSGNWSTGTIRMFGLKGS